MRQQIHRRALPGRQTEGSRRERILRNAFLNAPSALAKRPEPRCAFDNAARRDNPSRPWHAFVDPLRATAEAAAREGGVVAEQTETLLMQVMIALIEYVVEPLDPSRPVATGDLTYPHLVKEQAEAIEAQSLARGLPTPERIEAAVRETREAMAMSHLYVAAHSQQGSYLQVMR